MNPDVTRGKVAISIVMFLLGICAGYLGCLGFAGIPAALAFCAFLILVATKED